MAHTILLTGATGMVGQALAPLLACRNDVSGIFTLTHGSRYKGPPDKVMPVRGDVTAGWGLGIDCQASREILGRVTVIVHAAAGTRFSVPLHEARGPKNARADWRTAE